jgi:hypothetical protein
MQIRQTKRLLCSQRVSLICSDLEGWWHTVPGNLEDIAKDGATILSDGPIPAGKKVRILCGTNQLRGTAQSCVHDGVLGFFVEVQFDRDSQWSESSFRPQHLLNPQWEVPLQAAS